MYVTGSRLDYNTGVGSERPLPLDKNDVKLSVSSIFGRRDIRNSRSRGPKKNMFEK